MRKNKIQLCIFSAFMAGVLTVSVNGEAKETSALSLKTQELISQIDDASKGIRRSGGHIPDIDPNDPAAAGIHVPVVILLESASATLPDYVNEMHRRDDLALAMVPYSRLSELAGEAPVVRVETGLRCSATLDKAREFTNYEKIASGEGLPKVFTGRGVVAGFADIGFDPNHINFFNPETGNHVVKRMVDYSISSSGWTSLDEESDISAYETDDSGEWHATHVAGILCGNYAANGYQGIAPDVDLVATTSSLYDAFILAGCEQVISYAKEQGKPAVINISISSSTGPHDGSSLFNRYMEKITERDAIVCISSGNTGAQNMNVAGTFTAEKPFFRSYFRNSSWADSNYGGSVDVWSDNEKPLSCRLVIFDRIEKKMLASYPVVDGVETKEYMICSSKLKSSYPTADTDENFDKAGEGYVRFKCEINPLNNRFNILVSFDIYNVAKSPGREWADYAFGLEFSGSEGQEFNAFGSESMFFSKESDPESQSGEAFNAANDFCYGEGVVSVGAMVSRGSSPLLSGEEFNRGFTPGTVAKFSSYGERPDGSKVPVVVAPGADLISSVSRYYYKMRESEVEKECAAAVTVNGERYLWKPECGTSMSSPYVAGVIATWLEANPELTTDDVLDVLKSTNTIGPVDGGTAQWGGGYLDSYAGLRKVLGLSGVSDVSTDAPSCLLVDRKGRGVFGVGLLSGGLESATVTDLSGKTAMTVSLQGEEGTVDCSSLPDGVYILRVSDTGGATHSAKLLVR